MKEIIEIGIKINSEIMLLTLSQVQFKRGGPLLDEVITAIFP